MLKAVLFDFDGPLVNSFERHIDFCRRMNKKYSRGLTLPAVSDINDWRLIIGFPMVQFLVNIGFTAAEAQAIHDQDYLAEFGNQKNPAPLHSEIGSMLGHLSDRRHQLGLGIVSLNHRCNILASLGRLVDLFHEICSHDEFPKKTDALVFACSAFSCSPSEAVYIGDAEKDYQAADAVGMPFIGVSYGWEINPGDPRFPVVDSPRELLQKILALLPN